MAKAGANGAALPPLALGYPKPKPILYTYSYAHNYIQRFYCIIWYTLASDQAPVAKVPVLPKARTAHITVTLLSLRSVAAHRSSKKIRGVARLCWGSFHPHHKFLNFSRFTVRVHLPCSAMKKNRSVWTGSKNCKKNSKTKKLMVAQWENMCKTCWAHNEWRQSWKSFKFNPLLGSWAKLSNLLQVTTNRQRCANVPYFCMLNTIELLN